MLGFTSGHYDLKLIRKYFVTQLTQEKGVLAAEKEGRVMFIKTPRYNFLDIMNYMAPGTTYDKWVKAKGQIPNRKQASANEHEFASLLLRAGLVEVRELGLFVVLDLLVALVHLIVPGQGYVGGFEVLARLVFNPVVGCNPVEELGAVFHVLCIGRLVCSRALSCRIFSSNTALPLSPDRYFAR